MCYATHTHTHSLTENSVRSKTGVNSTAASLLQESIAKPSVNIALYCLCSLVTQYYTLGLEQTHCIFFFLGLQVCASSYFQLNHPTRCSNFSSLLLVV